MPKFFVTVRRVQRKNFWVHAANETAAESAALRAAATDGIGPAIGAYLDSEDFFDWEAQWCQEAPKEEKTGAA